MADLRKRFGHLVATHRRRRGLTQEQLAEAAEISGDMVAKVEVGASGARFGVIERIAAALNVDPAELFTADLPSGALRRGAYGDLSVRLAGLSEEEFGWLAGVIEAALTPISAAPASIAPSRLARRAPKARRRLK